MTNFDVEKDENAALDQYGMNEYMGDGSVWALTLTDDIEYEDTR